MQLQPTVSDFKSQKVLLQLLQPRR